MTHSKLNLRETPTEALLGGGIGVAASLCLLAAAHLGAFGEGGRSEKFVAIWATRTLPVVTLVCAMAAVAVPAMYSRDEAVKKFILQVKQCDRALGMSIEQLYLQEDSDAPIHQRTYPPDEFFFQDQPSVTQAQAVAPPGTVPTVSIQTTPQGHPQGHDRVQNPQNPELYSHPYNPLA